MRTVSVRSGLPITSPGAAGCDHVDGPVDGGDGRRRHGGGHPVAVAERLLQQLAHQLARLLAMVAHATVSSASVAASAAARTSDSSPVMYTRPVAPIMR